MNNSKVFIYSILVSFFLLGCEDAHIPMTIDQPDPNNKIDTISVLPTDKYVSFEKYVVLYDQSDYLIKTPLYSFMTDLYELTSYPDYSNYLSVANNVIQDANQNDRLVMSNYFTIKHQKYVLANFLGKGKCFILNKIDNKPVTEIIQETWSYYCGPLCGSGGRKYYIKNQIFLEVVDWISK